MTYELVVAVVLGIVEGLTEFLPISSTGHLILAGELLGFVGPKAETFEIFIQLGAILAVVVLYLPRFRALLTFRPRDPANARTGFSGLPGLAKMACACFPAAAVGLVFHKTIKQKLFGPEPVAYALIAGGIIMLLLEWKRPPAPIQEIEEISYLKAFQIGVVQCFALWPGVSRSGSMIVGGMFLGLSRSSAAEFSFLVAVPMMVMATGYDLLKSWKLLSPSDVPMFAVGFVVSFVCAMLAIRFFLALLRSGTLVPYGVYRIVFGALVLTILHNG